MSAADKCSSVGSEVVFAANGYKPGIAQTSCFSSADYHTDDYDHADLLSACPDADFQCVCFPLDGDRDLFDRCGLALWLGYFAFLTDYFFHA